MRRLMAMSSLVKDTLDEQTFKFQIHIPTVFKIDTHKKKYKSKNTNIYIL